MTEGVLSKIRPMVLPVLLIALMGFFISGCGGVTDVRDQQQLKELYKAEFGVPPSNGVKVLGVRFVDIGDSEVRFYHFEANPEVVKSLVSKEFVGCSKTDFDVKTKINLNNTPSWWRPAEDKLTSFYFAENWDKHGTGGSSHAWLGVNSEKTIVYVFVGLSF